MQTETIAPVESFAPAPEVASIETTAESPEVATAPQPQTFTLWQDPLSQQIIGLWSSYRKNRKALGSALETKKRELEGQKYGQWSDFLRHAGIPRASAERLIAGFKLYSTLDATLRAEAEAARVDLTKPSVLNAIREADFAFELGEWDKDRRAEFLQALRDAEKPQRKSSTKSTRSGGTAGIGAPEEPTNAAEAVPTLETVKSYVGEFLNSTAAASRTELAKALWEWLDDLLVEFAGESGGDAVA